MEKRIIVVDSQKLNGMQECMRKFKYSFATHLEPVSKPDYFERGDLQHKMLQVYYNMRKHRLRWTVNNKTHADIVQACVIAGRHHALKMQIDMDEVETGIKTFMQYAGHFADDGWNDIKAVEQVGSRILYEDDELIILYEVKIDLIIGIPGIPILPVDHKSGSQRREPSDLSNQFMGYCWFLGVNNIMINKIGFQKTLPPKDKFQRYLLSYTSNRLLEWQAEAAWWIKQGLDFMDRGVWPRNLTSCDKYSGCIYKNVCAADPIVRESKLLQLFETRTKSWDVGQDL